LQCNRLRWYDYVLRKDNNVWVKKCMDFVVEGVRPRGRPKRTWKEVMESLKLRKEDELVHGEWRRLIRGTVEDSGDSRVQIFLVPAHPGYPGLKGRKTFVVVH